MISSRGSSAARSIHPLSSLTAATWNKARKCIASFGTRKTVASKSCCTLKTAQGGGPDELPAHEPRLLTRWSHDVADECAGAGPRLGVGERGARTDRGFGAPDHCARP